MAYCTHPCKSGQDQRAQRQNQSASGQNVSRLERNSMSEPELNIWERALGWRKRQMIQRQLDPISNKIRNDTLEEVAKEFDAMKNGGDTTAGFAIYVRSLKK
jgi:hypothetical protein